MSSTPVNLDDYSPAATITTFPTPLPLLRSPTPSTPPLLAFTSLSAFFAAQRSTQLKLTQQCHAGAKLGCAIAASRNCKTSLWAPFFGRKAPTCEERERCEEAEMERCVSLAEERCAFFAEEKCVGPFGEAWVVVGRREAAAEVVGWAGLGGRTRGVELVGLGRMQGRCLMKCLTEDLVIIRGSDLLNFEQNGLKRE